VSAVLTEHEELQKAALAQMSPNQQRKWRNARQRAVNNVLAAIGDKALQDVTWADALKFSAMWIAIEDAKHLGLQSPPP
jgi:hypothetical protein